MKSASAPKYNEACNHSTGIALPAKIQSLDFVFEMLVELRKMAAETEEVSLMYFLEMAALEAGDIRDKAKFEEDALVDEL